LDILNFIYWILFAIWNLLFGAYPHIIGLLTRDSLQNKRKYGIPGFARKKLLCSKKSKSNSSFTKYNTY